MRGVSGGVFTNSGLIPTVYTGEKTATTVVAGQMVALGENTTNVLVTNLEAVAGNFAKVAFGTSQADAETNAANGVTVNPQKSILLGRPSKTYTHMAWVGDTGSVVINVTQGE